MFHRHLRNYAEWKHYSFYIYFAWWLFPADLAFDSSGNLFAANYGTGGTSGGIIEIMPKVNLPTDFVALGDRYGLAFDVHGNLFASSFGGREH